MLRENTNGPDGPRKAARLQEGAEKRARDGAEQAAQKGGEETFVVSWEQKLRDSRQELKDTVVAERDGLKEASGLQAASRSGGNSKCKQISIFCRKMCPYGHNPDWCSRPKSRRVPRLESRL